MIPNEQVKADLEQVYGTLQDGWNQYGWGDNGVFASHGAKSSGCLMMQMEHILTQCSDLHSLDRRRRQTAMIKALGFKTDYDDYYEDGVFVLQNKVAHWNDDKATTWDDVKERVKKAIGEL